METRKFYGKSFWIGGVAAVSCSPEAMTVSMVGHNPAVFVVQRMEDLLSKSLGIVVRTKLRLDDTTSYPCTLLDLSMRSEASSRWQSISRGSIVSVLVMVLGFDVFEGVASLHLGVHDFVQKS